jgi:hypothetical protein
VSDARTRSSFWPTERQTLLLQTAFADEETSARAWATVRPRLELDRLEVGSFPLLPLVHRRLERLGVDDPYLPRLAGIRRRTWTLNQLQGEALAPALDALEATSSQPIVVGGWEIPAHYYGGDLSLRPVDRLELLIRPGTSDAAVEALTASGFPAAERAGGATSLVGADGRTCVLHERFATEFSVPDEGIEPDDVWSSSRAMSLGGREARTLSATEELVRVCLAGARAAEIRSILWIADALAVFASERDAIDWERVVRGAVRLRATLRLRDALAFLSRELGAAVPETAIAALDDVPVRRRERLSHERAKRSPRVVATRFVQITAGSSVPRALLRLPTFLRDELGLAALADVPKEVMRRAVARVVDRRTSSIRGPVEAEP